MQERLSQILSDIRSRTGVCVSLTPRGHGEHRFIAECFGVQRELYLQDGGENPDKLCALVKCLVERSAAGDGKGLRDILLGDGGEWQAFRFMTKFSLTSAPCFALDVVPEKKLEAVAAHIAQCLDEDLCIVMNETRIAVVRFVREEQTAFEFAQFLSRTVYEEIGVRVRIGAGPEVGSFSEIASSYQQAATASRLSTLFEEKGDVHSYREYLLARMIEDVPKPKLNEYLKQFRVGNAAEIFKDEELAGTAEEFLESSLNASETARKLFVHRNTLNYRLDKIERTTGLNIRNFSDAVTYRVVSVLYRLLQS